MRVTRDTRYQQQKNYQQSMSYNQRTRKTLHIILGVIVFQMLFCTTLPAQEKLQGYINLALENNLYLKQKDISVAQAKNALKIASSYFYPSVTLLAEYTHGKGGRSIDIPIGDLMNPVYTTLNALTQSNNFPQVENVKQNFFPDKFYDVKVRASMPLLNTDLILNTQIKREEITLAELERASYKRTLRAEVKKAYYGYLSANELIQIYRAMQELTTEAKRVNERLLTAGKIIPVYLLRIESEAAALHAKEVEAQQMASNAVRYFNFLLNREENAEILADSLGENISVYKPGKEIISQREELEMLRRGGVMYQLSLTMKQYKWVPEISAFADFGAQDSRWKYSKDSRYYLYGVQLSLPLFEAFRNTYEQEEAEMNIAKNGEVLKETEKQFSLVLQSAENAVLSAEKNYEFARKSYEAAFAYYSLVHKGYSEGIFTMLELTDARSQLTSAQLSYSISKYKVLTAYAELERETDKTPQF